MHVELKEDRFDPWAELIAYRDRLAGPQHGANAVFVGTMRDFNEGDRVTSMLLEHYPAMTVPQLETVVADAVAKHHLDDALVMHRVGTVYPGDDIVLVSVWSAHRAEAFAACRDIMEALKSTVPFWKKEQLEGRERWVEKNTPG